MNLFDFHCDTPFELYKKQAFLTENDLHISLDKARCFDRYGQVMAIWTQNSLAPEEAWRQFHAVYDDFLSKIPSERAALCRTIGEYRQAMEAGKHPFFLAVEGAFLLNGDISRLDEMYRMGVRFLTLVWRGENLIGGAFDTDAPLTPFGREVAERCFSSGIAVDVSHASDAVTDECLAMARRYHKPVIATHSNSRAVFAHPRNLTDAHAVAIAETGGVIGISMAPQHLDFPGQADVESVCRHIRHYWELGLADAVVFGCDFDGIDKTPIGIDNLTHLNKIAESLLRSGVSTDDIEKIFWRNAERYLKNFE